MNNNISALILLAGSSATPLHSQVTHNGWFPGSSSISEAEIVPPAFRGTWAPETVACRDPDGVATVLISSGGIDFYESGGRLDRIRQSGQERSVLVKLSFEGDGGFWDQVQTWTLNQQGDKLTLGFDDASAVFIRCH